MTATFQVVALAAERFVHMLTMTPAELATHGARRVEVAENPGVPCRVSLVDAELGETAILVPFVHHDVATPYRASGPIFVRERASTATPSAGEVPVMLRNRLLSLRAYDDAGLMVGAEVGPGTDLEALVRNFFDVESVAYLHVHNARPGCFNCSIVRARRQGRMLASTTRITKQGEP